jgi:hypothetical protein
MSQENRISNEELNNLSVEDLLELQSGEVQHVEDYRPFPTADYEFTVKSCELDEAGKEKKPAIIMTLTLTDVDPESFEKPEEQEDMPELPAELKCVYMVQAKDGFGIRQFLTLGATIEDGESLTASQLIETLPGMQGHGIVAKRQYTNDNDEERTVNNLVAQSVEFH